jgi:uncharacterized protein (DUF779 family)
MKVSATPTALELIEDLKETHGKDLLFHQSGGCCDGSAPMCYPAKEYMVGDQDVLVGEIGGIPFYISKTQHEAWKNTDMFNTDFIIFKKNSYFVSFDVTTHCPFDYICFS